MTSAVAPPLAGLLDNINGIPLHPLLVHFAIAFAMAGALGGLAFVLVPKWRRWLTWPLIVVGAGNIFLGATTGGSGESLEKRVAESPLVENHTKLGGQMETIMIVYGALLIITMAVVLYRGRGTSGPKPIPTTADRIGGIPGETHRAFPGQPQIAAVLTVLVFFGAILSGLWIYRTGDAGAKAAWAGTPTTPIPESAPPTAAATTPATTSTATATTPAKKTKKSPLVVGAAAFTAQGCANCHTLSQANATGQGGPNLNTSDENAATMRATITTGRGRMPEFSTKLTAAQIAAIVAYIKK